MKKYLKIKIKFIYNILKFYILMGCCNSLLREDGD